MDKCLFNQWILIKKFEMMLEEKTMHVIYYDELNIHVHQVLWLTDRQNQLYETNEILSYSHR